MTKTLKDLALALINATLILLALCLFLAWKAASTVNGITENFARNLEIVEPLRGEVGGVRTELAGLRADLAALGDQSGEFSSSAMMQLQDRVARLDSRLNGLQTRVQQLAVAPERLIDQAIETSADAFARSVSDIRGCVPGA